MAATTPKLQLEYFNSSGRPELARWCFWHSQIPFEDVRLPFPEFAKRKAEGRYPHGQVPVLSVDGDVIPQSCAINVYAAKLAGLYPECPADGLRAEAIIQSVSERVDAFIPAIFAPEGEGKVKLIKEWDEKHGKHMFNYLEGIVAKNNAEAKDGEPMFIVGKKISAVDFAAIITLYDWIMNIPGVTKPTSPALTKYFAYLNTRDDINALRAKSKQACIDNAPKSA